jgi:hypothetical protein
VLAVMREGPWWPRCQGFCGAPKPGARPGAKPRRPGDTPLLLLLGLTQGVHLALCREVVEVVGAHKLRQQGIQLLRLSGGPGGASIQLDHLLPGGGGGGGGGWEVQEQDRERDAGGSGGACMVRGQAEGREGRVPCGGCQGCAEGEGVTGHQACGVEWGQPAGVPTQ